MKGKKLSPELSSYYKDYFSAHPEIVQKLSSQKFVFYIYVILTLVVVSFFTVVVIRPTVSTIFDLRSEYTENEEVLTALDQKLAAVVALKAQQQQLTQELALLNDVIPTSHNIPELVRKIEVIARENDVSLSQIETGNIEVFPNDRSDSPFYTFNFNMSVRGETRNLNSFLSDLIQFDRLISIDRVSGGSVTGGDTEYVIVGRSYFYNPVGQ